MTFELGLQQGEPLPGCVGGAGGEVGKGWDSVQCGAGAVTQFGASGGSREDFQYMSDMVRYVFQEWD